MSDDQPQTPQAARSKWPSDDVIRLVLYQHDDRMLTSADGKRVEVSLEAIYEAVRKFAI